MDTIKKSVLCDATPSWNGYNYQGKVGLYVCLKNILVQAQKGVTTTHFSSYVDEHNIEYEWIEDFAIKRNECYLSLHQVKHKSENNFTDHTEAISTILYRKNGVISDTDIFKYFRFKSKKKGDTEKAKAQVKNQIKNHGLIDKNGRLDKNWKTNIVAVNKLYRDEIEKCFIDFESLTNKAFSSSSTYFHTAEDVKPPKDNIEDVVGIPKLLVTGLTKPKSLACKNIYLSFDIQHTYELALSDSQLNHRLETTIKEILKLLHQNKVFSDSDIKLYKTALCSLIDQNLVIRHQHIRNKIDSNTPYLQKIKPSIYFRDIVTTLEKVFRELDMEYWNLICRDNFETAYKEQLDEIYEGVKLANSEDETNLYHEYVDRLEDMRINVIDRYFPNDCISFLRQIYPHLALGSEEHQFYNSISNVDEIKSVFLDFIQEVNKPIERLTINCHKNIFEFQPSCIDFNISRDRRRMIEIDKVKKGLADNANNQTLVHKNVDYIVVNSTNENDVINAGIKKITEVESYEKTLSPLKESDKFTERKNIKFIDSRKALGEING